MSKKPEEDLDTTACPRGVSLPAYLMDWTEKKAASEGRTFSNYITQVLVAEKAKEESSNG